MEQIINLSSIKPVDGLNKYESLILNINNINKDNYFFILPDTKYQYSIDEYIKIMKPVDKEKDFLQFIEQNKNKHFCVIGDYDCDGIMASIIMARGLNLVGEKCDIIIPNRFTDGYGIKKSHVDNAINLGAEILITVDNGIVANDVIKYAHSKNLKICVTDHHNPNGENEADVVIDPLYNNDEFKKISGATVAFKLINALYNAHPFDKKELYNLCTLSGFTTISDVMPMINENRIQIKAIMEYANNKVHDTNSFIYRLADLVGFYQYAKAGESRPFRNFNKTNIDYYFAPVINAINRVDGDVMPLVYDILEIFDGPSTAELYKYENINKLRKSYKKELLKLHHEMPESINVELLKTGTYINYSGISGLIASDIVDSEHKPAIIGVETNSDIAHFSGRSVSGFSLYNALLKVQKEHPEIQLQFGGHDEALGCSLPKENVSLLRKYLSNSFASQDDNKIKNIYYILDDADAMLNTFIEYSPYGNNFEFPKFYISSQVYSYNKKEYSFKLRDINTKDIICFNKKNLMYLTEIFFNDRERKVEIIISVGYDASGNPQLKLEEILNKDPEIIKTVNNKITNYRKNKNYY